MKAARKSKVQRSTEKYKEKSGHGPKRSYVPEAQQERIKELSFEGKSINEISRMGRRYNNAKE